MTPEQKVKAEEIIEKQLAMTAETLNTMVESGLDANQEVQIEFLFNATNEKSANTLAEHLTDSDCLAVSVKKSGGFLSRKYQVEGKTYPTLLNEEVLSQWLPWVVIQGIVRDCEFDGWGAEI